MQWAAVAMEAARGAMVFMDMDSTDTASTATRDFTVTRDSKAVASSWSDLVVAGVRGGGATPLPTILRLA